jgi:hypothetical protein
MFGSRGSKKFNEVGWGDVKTHLRQESALVDWKSKDALFEIFQQLHSMGYIELLVLREELSYSSSMECQPALSLLLTRSYRSASYVKCFLNGSWRKDYAVRPPPSLFLGCPYSG